MAHHAPVKEIIQRKFEIVRKRITVCLTKLRSQLATKAKGISNDRFQGNSRYSRYLQNPRQV
jgi:hypothetical protein